MTFTPARHEYRLLSCLSVLLLVMACDENNRTPVGPSPADSMYKDASNTLASDGWLWAEFSPDGSVGYSVSNRGTACTSCHQREQGPQNDLVRTFERQR